MPLTLIAAMSENRVIGRDGGLPWHLPADLKRFKRLTSGHAVIMGRRTFESIGKPLPNRTSIVLTHDPSFTAEGAIVAHSVDEALAAASSDEEVFVIGGANVYEGTIGLADTLQLTIVHADVEGDTLFPEVDLSGWALESEERHEPDEDHAHAYSFRVYRRG